MHLGHELAAELLSVPRHLLLELRARALSILLRLLLLFPLYCRPRPLPFGWGCVRGGGGSVSADDSFTFPQNLFAMSGKKENVAQTQSRAGCCQ